MCQVRPTSDDITKFIFSLEFVNTSLYNKNPLNTESYFFNTKAEFEIQASILTPFEIELAPKGFRYNRFLWGRGINCNVEKVSENTNTVRLLTVHAPIYYQKRFITQSTPKAAFSELAEDPLPILVSICHAMEAYRTVWEQTKLHYIASNSKWESYHGKEYEKDRKCYEDEITRYKTGLDMLKENPDLLLAFKLTNETFRRGKKTEWRLFQIVFLVCQIPSIASLLDGNNIGLIDREKVDIIYFPTGGGKTEAYLAAIVFHCFFDRLRGKTAGVTVWTRFPLRLLTVQQTQRVADVIGNAEIVRKEQKDLRLNSNDIDGFSVGYFVGEGGSPNAIINPQLYQYDTSEVQMTWSKVHDSKMRQDWKRVVNCPSCGTATVTVDFDDTNVRLLHRCSQRDCRFPNGIIPVFIVDNEIYRYLPSVIVGTIDKLAGIGNQSKFSMIFGQIDGRCIDHGYYKGRCCQKDCNDAKKLKQIIPKGLSGPTMIVQDELHLLKEGLGTFDAHYETFMQRTLSEFNNEGTLKIIASSATIEAFERQVNHLYGRDCNEAQVFPSNGPTLGNSFYAETLSSPQRLYVGLIPHNKTIFNAILELIELYHREVLALLELRDQDQNPYGGTVQPGSLEWVQGLDFYKTSLTYFLAKRELSSIHTDLEGDVIPHLTRDGLATFDISELTGDTSTDEVSRTLERLEKADFCGKNSDVVLASSMVSHGVDVDRFNSMIFYGIPRQNAEYIQASSRVGRSHVGIVFSCFHPVRERDQSHYSYFFKYHEFLGQLVEPVAINRWSQYSINRTLPGLFMGVLLQIIANRLENENSGSLMKLSYLKKKINEGTIQADDFIAFLEQAYGVVTPSSPGEIVFKNEISARVHQYIDWIRTPSTNEEWVSSVLIPKPMRSLRDVDEAIQIELDSIGSSWSTRNDDN